MKWILLMQQSDITSGTNILTILVAQGLSVNMFHGQNLVSHVNPIRRDSWKSTGDINLLKSKEKLSSGDYLARKNLNPNYLRWHNKNMIHRQIKPESNCEITLFYSLWHLFIYLFIYLFIISCHSYKCTGICMSEIWNLAWGKCVSHPESSRRYVRWSCHAGSGCSRWWCRCCCRRSERNWLTDLEWHRNKK
jgi:hypothetical protein